MIYSIWMLYIIVRADHQLFSLMYAHRQCLYSHIRHVHAHTFTHASTHTYTRTHTHTHTCTHTLRDMINKPYVHMYIWHSMHAMIMYPWSCAYLRVVIVREIPSVWPFGVYVGYLSRAVAIVIVVTTDNVPARLKGVGYEDILNGHVIACRALSVCQVISGNS